MFDFGDKKEIQLRDYQLAAIEELRNGLHQGMKRQVLVAGCGVGKTVMATSLLREADRKGSYSLFLVDRVSLVDQTSAVLEEYGIDHGVVQANHPRWQPRANVQVCSVQTLARRSLPRTPSLCIWDEVHVRSKAMLEYLRSLPDCVKVGLTATPFTKGMGKDWDRTVNVKTTRSLIDEGYLVEPTIYVAKSINTAKLKRNSFGEYSEESAASAGIEIIGDVVKEWQEKTTKHFGGPVKTIVFSANVDHGRELCAAFNEAGHNFQQISYLDKDDDARREKIAEFRRPDSMITGLVSCGVLQRGFDVPDVQVGISCRPYRKSLSSHIQEIGRVMRPFGEAKRCIWLCHSGNVERFAVDMFDLWENGAGELDKSEMKDSEPRETSEAEREKIVCPECGGVLRAGTCMACGWEKPARSEITQTAGVMQEFSLADQCKPRSGLHAECLKDPKAVWQAALAHCLYHGRGDENRSRKWAYGVWKGMYPDAKLPGGWFDMSRPGSVNPQAAALIEREIARFRKRKSRRAA